MIEPVVYDQLFEINDGLNVEFSEGVVYVDNFYKNYEEIYKILNNTHVPRWKNHEDGRNFIDYFDCRLELGNFFWNEKFRSKIKSLMQVISHFYSTDIKSLELLTANYSFNYFKNIKRDVSNKLQHFPHVDGNFNVIVYLDKICSGGTAIYPDIKYLENKEQHNLLYDISGTEALIIPSKPNRLVIFKGDVYHGGYIEDHNAYTGENWRINQVMFFDEIYNRTE